MPLEKTITAKIMKLLKSEGAVAVKHHGGPYSKNGVSDVLCCYGGRFLAIEVKQPGKQPTILQAAFLMDVAKAGGVGICVDSIEKVEEILQKINKGGL